VAAVDWWQQQRSNGDGISAATAWRWQRIGSGSGGSLAAARRQRWQQHGRQSGGRWRRQLGGGITALAEAIFVMVALGILILSNGGSLAAAQRRRRWQRGIGGGSSAAVATAARRQRGSGSSMVDGWKSCDVQLLCVCNIFTLICESRSTVPRGPPRLTDL
jgi:hypothetical protein